MKLFVALLFTLFMGIGCATLTDLGQDACDVALGGSKAGELCEHLDKLRSDEAVEEDSNE